MNENKLNAIQTMDPSCLKCANVVAFGNIVITLLLFKTNKCTNHPVAALTTDSGESATPTVTKHL